MTRTSRRVVAAGVAVAMAAGGVGGPPRWGMPPRSAIDLCDSAPPKSPDCTLIGDELPFDAANVAWPDNTFSTDLAARAAWTLCSAESATIGWYRLTTEGTNMDTEQVPQDIKGAVDGAVQDGPIVGHLVREYGGGTIVLTQTSGEENARFVGGRSFTDDSGNRQEPRYIELCIAAGRPSELFSRAGSYESVLLHEAAHGWLSSVEQVANDGDVEMQTQMDEVRLLHGELISRLNEDFRSVRTDELRAQLTVLHGAVASQYGVDSDMARSVEILIGSVDDPSLFARMTILVTGRSDTLILDAESWIHKAAKLFTDRKLPDREDLNVETIDAIESIDAMVDAYFRQQFSHLVESEILNPIAARNSGHVWQGVPEYVATLITGLAKNPDGIIGGFEHLHPERREIEISILEMIDKLMHSHDPVLHGLLPLSQLVTELRTKYPRYSHTAYMAALIGAAYRRRDDGLSFPYVTLTLSE